MVSVQEIAWCMTWFVEKSFACKLQQVSFDIIKYFHQFMNHPCNLKYLPLYLYHTHQCRANLEQNKIKNKHTYFSGQIFFSHADLRASSAVILFSGSNSNILSNKSSAVEGMKENSSLNRRRWGFLGFSVCHNGNLITDGHTAGVGVPQRFEIISSCINSTLPCPRIQ